MSVIDATRTSSATPERSPRRDDAIDLVRALCLVIVVLLHAMMVGVSVVDGVPVLENAMERWDGFPAASWVVQVMPLFFVLGGFSAIGQWTRLQRRGITWGGYVSLRLRRLLPAGAAAVTATAIALAVLVIVGVDPAVLEVAGFRIAQPLWFLAVYLLCTVCVPPLVAMHRRAPRRTLAALAALVVAIDLTRRVTGIDALGFFNLIFVWLLMHQIGFVLAETRVEQTARSRTRVTAIAITSASALVLTTALGFYPVDLYAALNPPTGALVLLGIVQTCLVVLFREPLSRAASLPALRRAASAINGRAMTIYAWHMPVLVLAAGATIALWGEVLPAPASADWWLGRPAWLIVAGVLVWFTVRAAARFEDVAAVRERVGGLRAFAAAALGAGGLVLLLAAGSALASWVIAAAAITFAVRMVVQIPLLRAPLALRQP